MVSDPTAPSPEAPPDEAAAHAELAEERHVAGSPHAVAAGAALLALTRAARSFTLYDPANKVVRALIASYRERFEAALLAHGALVLEVHPFELLLGREVVYLERDRERSLAFRLFRDGVRRLAFDRETSWDELLRLLQILSIRYTGVRQQEDDLVTLLRKAGFDHLHVAAIEGFVPEEEQEEGPLDPALLGGARERYDPPPQWDTPLPPFQDAAPLLYRPVTDGLRARLRAEEDDARIPEQAVRATAELLRAAAAASERDAALAFALEVREFLLVEKRADLIVELGRLVRTAIGATPDAAAGFLDAWLDARTLGALVAALAPDAAEAPAPLAELVDAAPAAVVDRLFELLAAEADGPRAPLLRLLLARSCRSAPGALVARLWSAGSATAAALFRLLESVDAQAALGAALEATTKGDAALQREALRHLGAVPFTPEIARGLHHLVESKHDSVRLLALPVMAARGGPRVFAALLAHVERHVARLGVAEAEAAGQALVRASAREAIAAFEAWLHPKGGGLLGKLVKMHAPPPLQHVALAGLRGIAGPEAQALLSLLAEHGDASLRDAAAATVAARAHAPGGRRG